MSDRHIVVVEENDNVATAVRTVDGGEAVDVDVGGDVRTIAVTEDIPFGHKIALEDIEQGATVYKYGTSIGNASQDIGAGDRVHVHNVDSNYGRGDLANEAATTVGE